MRNKELISIIVVCLLLASGATAFAQPPGGRGQRQGNSGRNQPPALPDSAQIVKIVDDLESELSLTGDQKAQISKLYFSHFSEAQELMGDEQGRNEDHRSKMDALRDEFESDVKAVLSEEQIVSFEKSLENHRPRSGQQRNGNGRPASRN